MKAFFHASLMLACVAAPLTATGAEQAAATSAAPPAALDRPSLQSPKALGLAFMALTHAGARLVASGERGTITYSDDQGQHWRQAATPTNASIVALRFLDSQRGWAAGHMGLVLHTEDGGQTWSKQLDGVQAARLALDAARADGADGRAQAQAEALVADGPDKPFFDLCFIDQHTGFVVGAYNMAFRTDDGGRTWRPWSAHIDNPKGLHLYGMAKAGDQLYIVGEQGLLLRSDDGGQNFKTLPSPYKGSWFGLTPTSDGALVLYGLRGNVFISRDQGQSWHQAETGIPVSISAAIELDGQRLALVNQAGQVLLGHADGSPFRPLSKIGLPIAAAAQTADGLALATLRGVVKMALDSASH